MGEQDKKHDICIKLRFIASTETFGAKPTRSMVHGENRIPYRIDRSLTDLAGPDYDATISFGLPFELGDCPYGKSRIRGFLIHAADVASGVNLCPRCFTFRTCIERHVRV